MTRIFTSRPNLPLATAAWVAIPIAIHLFILVRFWANAPVLDDYDFIRYIGAIAEAGGVGDLIQTLFAVGNEHRGAIPKLLGYTLMRTTGGLDYRVLTALGTLFMLGTFALLWAEFRHEASGPIAGAAAFLVFQWSYSEALIQATGAIPHIGVMLIAFAALGFALRPGWKSALACGIGGVLAAYTQANGLFVLPIAAFACLASGRPGRGIALLGLAAAVWLHYFTGYQGQPGHPSPLVALQEPVNALQFFLVNIGAAFPSLTHAQLIGAALLAGIGWLAWKGLWRRHPTVFLWIAFVLASAAIIAVGRVGFGVFIASRYAVNAALLMGILVFAAYSITRPWRPGMETFAWAVAGFLSISMTLAALPEVRERAFRARLLVEVPPSGQALGLPQFAGVIHPGRDHAVRVLEMAIARGWYIPPRPEIHAPDVAAVEARPRAVRRIGSVDKVIADGADVVIEGWSDIAAPVQGRRFLVHAPGRIQSARLERLAVREDVATLLRRPETLLSGFHLRVTYASEAEARRAVAEFCVFTEAPGQPMTELVREGVACQ